jgi:hypothetical protein
MTKSTYLHVISEFNKIAFERHKKKLIKCYNKKNNSH